MQISKEVAVPTVDKRQNADQRTKKYLWFGYGNYGAGNPTPQIGGGNIRNPGVFEELSKDTQTKPGRMTGCMYLATVLVGSMAVVMLLAWGLSLIVR
jgi:hypothetical protein